MTATILDFATRAALIRKSRENPPDPSCLMIAAKEHERLAVAALAQRSRDALERLAEIPSDSEAHDG